LIAFSAATIAGLASDNSAFAIAFCFLASSQMPPTSSALTAALAASSSAIIAAEPTSEIFF